MKRIILYLSMIAVVATALYYGSYRYFYSNSKFDEIVAAPEDDNRAFTLLGALLNSDDSGDEENAAAMQTEDVIVTRTTQVVMEYYNKDTGRTTYENLENNTEFLGYNREALVQYTRDYLSNMSVEDQEKGLYDYQVTSFAGNQISLRKSYDPPEEENSPKYFVGILDYMVVIYCNDDAHTVYEITDIDSRLLPVQVANQLSEGIYFYEEYDLYNFLEAYSS